MEMSESDRKTLERWNARTDEELRQKHAEQDFINRVIDSLYASRMFDACPDSNSLYEIADLAVRLAHSCYKSGAKEGFGIKGKFIRAVRRHARNRAP